jgi:hypothetical protein
MEVRLHLAFFFPEGALTALIDVAGLIASWLETHFEPPDTA